MYQILQIGSTVIKTPAAVTWSLQDLSSPDTGRTLDGIMHKDRVAQKVKLTCKWPAMSTADASILLKAVNANVNFQLTYFDVQENGNRTATFYVGDRTAPYLWIREDSKMVENISFDFIEV